MNETIKKTNKKSLIPDIVNPSPDYYCTWQTQLYATSDGKPEKQRQIIGEKALFTAKKPYGWAYFYEKARQDLFLVMDDSWDVPSDGNEAYYGSLRLSEEKFPSFCTEAAEPLEKLSAKMRAVGWKGLGGWVCAQESKQFFDGADADAYWIERLKMCQASGLHFLKLDWGEKSTDAAFRKRLVQLEKKYAPDVIIENAVLPEAIAFSDLYRTYDVPAIMSIPMTMEKLADCLGIGSRESGAAGLLNCEDEVYIAAAGGFTMGVMRHPYAGCLPDGRADMSFPACHRNLKTKMKEVERAVNWHKLAPAFGVGEAYCVAEKRLTDTWKFEKMDEEIESWWLNNKAIKGHIIDNVLTMQALAGISRGMPLPEITPDAAGLVPYVVAAKHPNGAVSVATLGRTLERAYTIPRCDVSLQCGGAEIVGVFGCYNSLTLHLEYPCDKASVFMQDLAGDTVLDVTAAVQRGAGTIKIPGALIAQIGTAENPANDTSEPGVVLRISAHTDAGR